MSTGERIPLEYADRIVRHLARTFVGLTLDPVGSVRRRSERVGDIEFVAPCPREGDRDLLWLALSQRFYPAGCVDEIAADDAGGLFGATTPRLERIGDVVQGLAPRFRHARLVLHCVHPERLDVKVEIYRYDPGERGNRGWIELIRTGPGEFGQACLARWKKLSGGKSDKGYPVDGQGRRYAVASEEAAFSLLKMPWVEPKVRCWKVVPR